MKNKRILLASVLALTFGATSSARSQWVQFDGPKGNVTSLATIDANLFAGTDGGGVYLSTDSGASWANRSVGLTNPRVRALAVIGTNLFAGSYGNGVFRSSDNGTTWTTVNVGMKDNDIVRSKRKTNKAQGFRTKRNANNAAANRPTSTHYNHTTTGINNGIASKLKIGDRNICKDCLTALDVRVCRSTEIVTQIP